MIEIDQLSGSIQLDGEPFSLKDISLVSVE